MASGAEAVRSFIEAACVPQDGSHSSGTLDTAQAILARQPDIASLSVHAASVLGDDVAVRRWVGIDPAHATAPGGPYEWDALTHLCFSRYLRLDRARSDAFVRAAKVLLDAGASASTGWFESGGGQKPVWESALYGAAGIAHDAGLTRLLLEHGADPNDEEVPYHTPESYDNEALKALVESGKLSSDSLATMLLRKTDWHDFEGVRFLLANGADPNFETRWGKTAIHQAVTRDNSIAIVELLLDHGALPSKLARHPGHPDPVAGTSATTIAARRGRADVLELLASRGHSIELEGVDGLIAACAMNERETVRDIAAMEPQLARDVLAEGGRLLAEFAGNGNVDGMQNLLDLGVKVDALYRVGDGYFGIAPASTALHVAAWRGRHAAVKLLIARGASIEAVDGGGRTPLMLAVKACVDSYWTDRRGTDSIEALLDAGASAAGIHLPSGYAEADALLVNAAN